MKTIFLTLMVGQKTLSHLLLIGLGRFRILGWGARFRILGMPGRGTKSQQAHDVVTTSMRRNDVASTSLRRHRRHFDVMCPLGF